MKRQRGRGRKSNGGGHHHHQNRNFESNGPDVKIRGSASHVYDKYQQLARDAASAGDRVAAESYLQHAEHYFRMMRAQQQHQQQNQQHHQQQQPQQNPQHQQPRPDDIGNRDFGGGFGNGRDDFEDAGSADGAAQPPASSPLDVVDPEAVEAASNGDRDGDERAGGGDEMRSRRRRRRRYEGGGQPTAGDAGEEAAEAGSASFDRA